MAEIILASSGEIIDIVNGLMHILDHNSEELTITLKSNKKIKFRVKDEEKVKEDKSEYTDEIDPNDKCCGTCKYCLLRSTDYPCSGCFLFKTLPKWEPNDKYKVYINERRNNYEYDRMG